MDKRERILLAGVGLALVLCTVTAVTASTWTVHTPLFMVRMEKASSEMNFLPTQVNEFTYTAEKGYTLDHFAAGCCGAEPLATTPVETCITCDTCLTCPFTVCTCEVSCGGTCPYTCDDPTCGVTCIHTCPPTCPSTCEDTCEYTCDDPTCFDTCEQTCRYTCEKPCIP